MHRLEPRPKGVRYWISMSQILAIAARASLASVLRFSS